MQSKGNFKKGLLLSLLFFIGFMLWTALVCLADRSPIGPRDSVVGLSVMNAFFRDLIGSNMYLYLLTDWLGLVPIATAFCFAVAGLVQWIRRKHILKVDADILALGVFYILVMAVYVLFEFVVINRRPVLIEGYLESSYPSSTTLLVLTVIPATVMQLNARIKNKTARICTASLLLAFTAFMLLGRVISGVHWMSDIIGSILISASLVTLYGAWFYRLKGLNK